MSTIPPTPKSDNNDRSRSLLTTTAVIAALGGTGEVARLMGRGQSAICNWLHFDHLPPSTYLAMTRALTERGLAAPPWLWGMEPRPPRHSWKPEGGERDDLWSPGARP
jgi:hypothetical protein